MTVQEKRNVMEIVSSILIFGVYALVMYNRYNNGVADMSDPLVYWGRFMLILILVNIVAKIVITIIYTIMASIVNEVKGNDPEDLEEVVDERDKLIATKSMRNSMVIFFVGFVASFFVAAFGGGLNVFFMVLLLSGLLSDVFGSSSNIYYYRKGV